MTIREENRDTIQVATISAVPSFMDVLAIFSFFYIIYRLIKWLIRKGSTNNLGKKYHHDHILEKQMLVEYAKGIIPVIPKFEFITAKENDFSRYAVSKPLKTIVISQDDANREGVEVEYICKLVPSTNDSNDHIYSPPNGLFSSVNTEAFDKITDVYYMIPGNPGNCLIYHEFLEKVCKKLSKTSCSTDSLVCCVSLRGHSYYYPAQWWTNIPSNGKTLFEQIEAYSLEEQIDYHVFLIQKLSEQFANRIKIHLLGHSVGCMIISRVLERLYNCIDTSEHERFDLASETYRGHIGKIFFFYPTVQHMHSETPNGQSLLQYLIRREYRFVLTFILYNCLSPLLPNSLVRLFRSSEPILVPWAPYYVNSMRIVKNITHLANHEFDEILDSFGIHSKSGNSNSFKNALRGKRHDIHCIFSTTDQWVPRKHCISFLEHIFDLDFSNDVLTDADDQKFCHIVDNIIKNKTRSSKDNLSDENEAFNSLSERIKVNSNTRHAFVIHREDLDITSELIVPSRM